MSASIIQCWIGVNVPATQLHVYSCDALSSLAAARGWVRENRWLGNDIVIRHDIATKAKDAASTEKEPVEYGGTYWIYPIVWGHTLAQITHTLVG